MAAKCDMCGIEGSIESAFFKEHRSFRTSTRSLCPNCWTKRHASVWKQSLSFVLILGLAGVLFVVLPTRPDYFFLNLFLFQLFLWVGVFPHEFGHAGMAHCLGLKVLKVQIGTGPVLGVRKLLGLETEFRAFPGSGLAMAAHQTTRWLRTKHLAFVLAGPGANLLMAAAIWPFLNADHGWSMRALKGGMEPAWAFFYANMYLLLLSLWPSSVMTSLGKLPSDGKQILSIPFLSRSKCEDIHAGGFAMEGVLALQKGDLRSASDSVNTGISLYPNHEALLNVRGVIWIELGKYEEARSCFAELLRRESKQPLMRPLMLNNVAYADALLGGEDRLEEADQYSKEAMEAIGWMAAVRGTRGTVLLMLGRHDEARPLLLAAMNEADTIGNKASNACMLAMLEGQVGNAEAARQYLALAKEVAPACHLLARAQAEVSRTATGLVVSA